ISIHKFFFLVFFFLAFCPQSSSKAAQSIVKDHMLSHYKKIYSAKGELHFRYMFNKRSSIVASTPRLNSSVNAKDIVYPSCSVNSHYARPSSERRYRSPDTTFQRKQSTCSLVASRDQGCYNTFQDPVKKTYSGDLLEKHSQHFTQKKPFTPKTLKSDKSSYLSRYRYYRGPQIKSSQDDSNSKLLGGETVGQREEELLYLEFISSVTEDILSRGHISDRMLNRVMNRHIEMNLHRLDEGKMRHLLEVLSNEFEEPFDISTSTKVPLKHGKALLDSVFSHFKFGPKPVETKEDDDVITHALQINHPDLSDYDDLPWVSTRPCSPVRTASSTKTRAEDEKKENDEEGVGLKFCSGDLIDSSQDSQEDFLQTDITEMNVQNENCEHTTTSSDVNQSDKLSKEAEDLGNILSESLHMSSKTDSENVVAAEETNTNRHEDVSDDDF
uniref:Spermatogenesis associated 7 n=1 Tax=Xiphophorus couchianus TaxID=32473 RepID=A0A3B5MGA8_9TELE